MKAVAAVKMKVVGSIVSSALIVRSSQCIVCWNFVSSLVLVFVLTLVQQSYQNRTYLY